MFEPGFLEGGAVKITKTDSGAVNGGTYNFGSSANDRIILAAVAVYTGIANNVTGCTIASNAATLVVSRFVTTNPGFTPWVGIWALAVPSGTSGVVTISASGAIGAIGIGIYAMNGAGGLTPFNTNTGYSGNAVASVSSSINIPSAGIALAVAGNGAGSLPSYTWTGGLAEDLDFGANSTSGFTTGASSTTGSNSITVSASAIASNVGVALVAASWGP